MNYPLILIVGQAGSGKDTFASMLTTGLGKNATSFALADPIKEFVRNVLGFTDDQLWGPSERRMEEIQTKRWPGEVHGLELYNNAYLSAQCERFAVYHPPLNGYIVEKWVRNLPDRVTARHVLQTLGTEIGRKADSNIWVNAAMKTTDRLLADRYHAVIITDGRFKNEILKVKERGGIVIKVRPPEATATSTHSSETEQTSVPDYWFDYIVTNNKDDGPDALNLVANLIAQQIVDSPATVSTTSTKILFDLDSKPR